MSNPFPFADAALLLRWLAGFLAVVALPGWALCSRHTRGLDTPAFARWRGESPRRRHGRPWRSHCWPHPWR